MERRSFIKSIGLLVGSVALASQGVYLKAKEKVAGWGSSQLKKGDVFTIAGVCKPRTTELIQFTVTKETSSNIEFSMDYKHPEGKIPFMR